MRYFLLLLFSVIVVLSQSGISANLIEEETDGFFDEDNNQDGLFQEVEDASLITEFNERSLYNEVSSALKCRKYVTKGPKFPVNGQIIGNNLNPFICLQVKAKPSKKKGIHVIFLINNNSSESFVSVTTLGLLGFKPKSKKSILTPVHGTIHGEQSLIDL